MNYQKNSKLMVSFTLIVTLLFVSGAVAVGAYAAQTSSRSSSQTVSTDGTLAKFSKNTSIIYENGIYYVLCGGATAKDKPISEVTKGSFGVTLVWKDHYSSYGPFDNTDNLVSEIKKQCEFLLNRKAITQEEAKIAEEAAADIQLNSKQYTKSESGNTESQTSSNKEYEQWGINKIGDAYYYKNQRVRIFVDMRADKSYVTFHYDKKFGTIDLRMERYQNGTVKKVRYLTKTEASKILNDTIETTEKNVTSGFDKNDLYRLDYMSPKEVDALALSYIAETGQFGYVYNMRPYMTKAGIDAAVKAYLNTGGDRGVVLAMLPYMSSSLAKKIRNESGVEYQNSSESNKWQPKEPNTSRSFDYSVLSRLDTLSPSEVDALALSYIAATGQFGHIYNMKPYMTKSGIDAAVKAFLDRGGDPGVVRAMYS